MAYHLPGAARAQPALPHHPSLVTMETGQHSPVSHSEVAVVAGDDFDLFVPLPYPCSCPTKPPVPKRPGNKPRTLGAFSLTTIAVVGPTGVFVGPSAVAVVQSPVVVVVTVAVGHGDADVAAEHPTDGPAVPAVVEAGESVEPEFESHVVVHQLADSITIAAPYPLGN